MKNVSKLKIENALLIPVILLAIVSIVTLLSSASILPDYVGNVAVKQVIWFSLGFVIAYGILYIGGDFIYRHCWIIYGLGIILLILVLFFGKTINGSTSWFSFFGMATFQPSEFMKIALILVLATLIKNFHENNSERTAKAELFLIGKILLVTFIPAVLTFLEPDTGVVIIYGIIALVMLFISGIRYRWFFILIGLMALIGGLFFIVYATNQDLFIDIFGTNLFYRIDRILNWTSGAGMQYENSIASIGSAGLWGYGFNKVPLYFPEAQTDFIFSVFTSSFGIIPAILLITLIVFFDFKLISLANKTDKPMHKYILAGIIAMLLYQQIQNIGMTIGLLPITGITLPFISYGGSSLISYMILLGLVFSISNENLRYTNK